MWKDAKYLLAYLSPLAAFIGLKLGGIYSPGSVYLGFVIIPLVELVLPPSAYNPTKEEELQLRKNRFFDIILYLNLPIFIGLLLYFYHIILTRPLTGWEVAGMILNMGVIAGSMGINVAHELGHRHTQFDRWIARLLLIPNLYGHFTIEHNWGHHKNVATPEDPATARKGEPIYIFWPKTITGSYINAWKLEAKRLAKKHRAFFSVHNELLWITLAELIYLVVLWIAGGFLLVLCGIAIALTGILLLETVNYIEHYGLVRRQLPDGTYESQTAAHSWNSDHVLGRIYLYELTRHADHHMRPTKKYQTLHTIEASPQLPVGYPASMLISLLPPLWFRMIDKYLSNTDNSPA